MNANIRSLLCGVSLAVAMSSRLFAVEPAPAMPVSGKILIFDHGGILEGDVERVGERYRIRSGMAETWVPAAGVIGLAADKAAAFQLMKQRAKLDKPMERVRLARWCQSQGLKRQAVEEAEAALALKPQDRSLKYFRDEMKAFAAFTPVAVGPMSPAATKKPDTEPMAVDVSPESLGLFATKVQPILMNACAKCHGGEYTGKFKLNQALSSSNKQAMQANLAAVSAAIDRQQPASSLLLAKAVSVHGDSGTPPLKDRQTAAYKHLSDWVRLAAGNPPMTNPQPASLPASVIADAIPLAPGASPMRQNSFASDADVKPAATPAKPTDAPPLMPKPPDADLKEPAKPKPGDPFDP